MKKVISKTTSPNTVPCLGCGHPVSIYCFSPVRDQNGQLVSPRCPNCGFFEDPE